jgi:hypothetical protein
MTVLRTLGTMRWPSWLVSLHCSLLLLLAIPGVAGAAIRFSPFPPVAGQPIVVTVEAIGSGCGQDGLLELATPVAFRHVTLSLLPPNCPFLPPGPSHYTATTTIGPLPAGTYTVQVNETDGQSFFHLHTLVTLEVKEPPVCNATDTALCLGGGRFEVTGVWADFQSRQGVAQTLPLDPATERLGRSGPWGQLWFFSADNPEILAKVLDGCALNNHYWVFLSPASTVQYDITVRDAKTGAQKTYSNPLGTLPRLVADTQAFPCS